jgi:ParB/RepB/Spo0J family partition protein
MNEVVKRIELDDIVPSPGNRHHGGFDPEGLASLADSIKAGGVHEPAIVRPKGEGFELVAGERRWRASKLAGVSFLPCIVRNMTDDEVYEVQLVENVQRESISPLDEADGYAHLQEAGKDTADIAAAVGRPVSYVYQRLRLRSLVPDGRDLLIAGKMGVAQAIMIARLEESQQKQVLKAMYSGWHEDNPPSLRELASYIESYIMLELVKTSWKLDDEKLIPEAGSCKNCQKRTGFAPMLFADIGKKDFCLDRNCFAAKEAAMVTKRRAELAEEEHLEVSTDYNSKEKGVLPRNGWEECKKSDEGAIRVLVVEGQGAGKVAWGKPRQIYGATTESQKEAQKRERKLEKARVDLYLRLYREIKARAQTLLAPLAPMPEELLRVIVRHIWERTCNDAGIAIAKAEGWEKPESGSWTELVVHKIDSMNASELTSFIVVLVFGSYSKPEHYSPYLPDRISQGAKALGFDAGEIVADVAKESGFTAEELAPLHDEETTEEN